jgi:trigger factor
LTVEETTSFTHKYEIDYKDEKFCGQTVNFEIKIKMVRGSILPELNDEFAKQVGPFENVQAMHEAVKGNLVSQSKAEYDDEYFTKAIEKIKENAAIKYPPQVLNHELEHVMEDLKSRLAEQGLDMAAYLKSREMDEEKFISEEARPIAVKRIERSLIMDELAKAEKIDVSREMLQSSFEQTWGEYQGNKKFKKAMRGKSQPPKQIVNAVAMESANRAFVQQTLDRLKEIATGQAPDLQKDDLDKPISKKPVKASTSKDAKNATSKKVGKKRSTQTVRTSKIKKVVEE